MKRIDFLKFMAAIPLSGIITNLKGLQKMIDPLESTQKMPVLFIGHGSPSNATEINQFVNEWKNIAKRLPKPKAILCVSAHWETKGTHVTAMASPKTIHDFGGFPQELYAINYEVQGNPQLAMQVKNMVHKTAVTLNQDWGLDHGCWVPLLKMYPDASIPVIQLSLDRTKGAAYHYELSKELKALREKGVLIIGSGNMVHNLGRIALKSASASINDLFGFDWAWEMNDTFKKKILAKDHNALINYETLGKAAKLAIPTTDHYFPLLYSLALQDKEDNIEFFNDAAIAGSLTMTSVTIGL